MRLAFGALLLSSLFLQEDLSGDWERGAPPPWYSPPVKLVQLQNTFGYPQAFCWVSSQSQWALPLALAATLLLWAWAQAWIKGAPPEPKPETQRELDIQIPQKRGSLCICGEPPIPRFARFEPLCRRRRSSSVICHIFGERCKNVDKLDHRRKYPPVIPRILSSSSSSSSSFSSTQLKHLAIQSNCGRFPTVTTEDSSWMVSDSLEEPESETFDPSPEADNHRSHKIEQKHSSVYHRYPNVKKPVPQIREITECSKIRETPEKPLPEKCVPSFAQISFVQSSAFEKDDAIFLVEKSLQIRMVPPDGDKPPILIEEEGGDKPKVLALLGRIMNAEGDLKVEKAPTPKAFSPTGHFGWNVAIRTTSAPSDFDPSALIVDKMGEGILGFLEFHVKKKMVQSHCGVPTVVVQSLQHFHSLGETEQSAKRLTPICTRSPASLALAHRNVKAIYSKPRQNPPKEKERYILHRATEVGRVTSAIKKPSVVMASSQDPSKYVLLSMQPDELKRIVFHVTVKMLEIKREAFPKIVEGSLRTFSRFSCHPLPKTIRLGNKVPRAKQAALPFFPEEVLCLLNLNIKHKYLVYVWRLPAQFDEASDTSEGQKTPVLVNKGMVQAQLSRQILTGPGSQTPLGLLPSSPLIFAEETPERPAQLLAEEMKEGHLEMMQEGHLQKVHKEHKEKTQEGYSEKMKGGHLEMLQEGHLLKVHKEHKEKTPEGYSEKMKEGHLEMMQEGHLQKVHKEHKEKTQEGYSEKMKGGHLEMLQEGHLPKVHKEHKEKTPEGYSEKMKEGHLEMMQEGHLQKVHKEHKEKTQEGYSEKMKGGHLEMLQEGHLLKVHKEHKEKTPEGYSEKMKEGHLEMMQEGHLQKVHKEHKEKTQEGYSEKMKGGHLEMLQEGHLLKVHKEHKEKTPEGYSEKMKEGHLEMMQEGHLQKVHKEHKEKTQEGYSEKMKGGHLEMLQEGHLLKVHKEHKEKTPEGYSEKMKEGHLEMMQEGHLLKVHKEHKEKTPEGYSEKMKEGHLEMMQEGHLPKVHKEHKEKTQEVYSEKMKEGHLEMMQEGHLEKTEEQHPEKTQEARGQKSKEGLLPSPVESPKPPAQVTEHEERSGMEPEGHLTCAVLPQMVGGEALPEVDNGKTLETEEAAMSLKQMAPGRSSEEPQPPPFGQRGEDGEGSEMKEDGGLLKQPERPPSCKAVLRPGVEKVSKRPKEDSIMRASLILQLDLAKEKLNVHFQKKLDAMLQTKQGAQLDFEMRLDGRTMGHRRRHAHRSDRPASHSGSQPHRPFCYVCMPLDDSGTAVKTVRWTLPSWIQEMNGHRVPQVIRFERKATGGK